MSDPYFDKVTVLLRFDKENYLYDYSGKHGYLGETRKNEGCGLSSENVRNGQYSLKCVLSDLNPKGYNISTCISPLFDIKNDFTAEGWFYPIKDNHFGFFQLVNYYTYFKFGNYGDKLDLYTYDYYIRNIFNFSQIKNRWVHVALCRNSNLFEFYIDGAKVYSEAVRYIDYKNYLRFCMVSPAEYNGEPQYTSNVFAGYIDSFRFTSGVSRYTDDFTPPNEFWYDENIEIPKKYNFFNIQHHDFKETLLETEIKSIERIEFNSEQKYKGNGFIEGIVTLNGKPASKPVSLFNQQDNVLIGKKVSDSNGAYRFDNVNPNYIYYVVSHDETKEYNAVIADHIVPETK